MFVWSIVKILSVWIIELVKVCFYGVTYFRMDIGAVSSILVQPLMICLRSLFNESKRAWYILYKAINSFLVIKYSDQYGELFPKQRTSIRLPYVKRKVAICVTCVWHMLNARCPYVKRISCRYEKISCSYRKY